MSESVVWDAETAWAETALTVQHLSETHQELAALAGELIVLDFHFRPDGGDLEGFLRALKMFGYEGRAEGQDVQVSVENVPFTAEAIWKQEEPLARLALARGFQPDGWGFFEP